MAVRSVPQAGIALQCTDRESCHHFSPWGLAAAQYTAALGCHCLLAQPLELPVERFGHSLIFLTSPISFALSLPAILGCGVVKQHCFSHVSKGVS